jgi:hemerythrin superfamily protein
MPATAKSVRNPPIRRRTSAAETRREQKRIGTDKRSKGIDAVALLKDDHQRVDKMFKQFDEMKNDGEEKAALVKIICDELKAHTTVEEEIFYPAMREAIRDAELLDEADVEHESAKTLIAQLESMKPGDDHYDAKVTVLGEYVRHHVKEEQQQMFPKARKAKMDLKALGARIAARKVELTGEDSKTAFLEKQADLAAVG